MELLVDELKQIEGVKVLMPAGTFYVFPNVAPICKRLGITSHGLAMFLLEGADDKLGRGVPGRRVLRRRPGRASCASVAPSRTTACPGGRFLADAVTRTERVERYLEGEPEVSS